ncbi:MAG TPA: O-methyltransferase [Gemmatimonadaceae bacterium]|nr:O-methyltransferase [Gemmatimonadaceae bacterium]
MKKLKTRPRKKADKRPRKSRPRSSSAKKRWTEVDRYLCGELLIEDQALDAAVTDSVAGGLPAIAVTPNQGKLLQMLAAAIAARTVLEIGTLGGYSTIWLARAVGYAGSVVTLELDPKHAAVARKNFVRAGLEKVIDLRVGNALDTLPELAAERKGPFDLIFIDADKENIPAYYEWAVKLARPGSLIIVDNVVRDGEVINGRSKDPSVQGVRRFLKELGRDSRVTGTAIQTVGSKGYDGFAIVRVR